LAASFQRVREGSQLKFISSYDGDPVKQQKTQAAIIGLIVAKLLPAIQAASAAAPPAQAGAREEPESGPPPRS
jgi:hypothetical protein